MAFETLCIVGMGYIGLPTAAVFAATGTRVHGVEINPDVCETINRGEVHIIEPGLDAVVKDVVARGLLHVAQKAIPADAFLIAVPTPFHTDSHAPNLAYVMAAAETIAPHLKAGDLVVLESTSPVGATEQVCARLAALRPDLSMPAAGQEGADIHVVYCPERVLPGRIMEEILYNDRLIGGITPTCAEQGALLYGRFVRGQCIQTEARTAEMVKLSENSFRDVNIAFANELSVICANLGIDVWSLIELANKHPRVNILEPGPGVGGHCIAVDPWFIVASDPEQARIIRTARQVNDAKPAWVFDRVVDAVRRVRAEMAENGDASEVRVACYGVAFKPDIDDLRESPAVQIVASILRLEGVAVTVIEPNITQLPRFLSRAQLSRTQVAADVHVMLVKHRPFVGMDRPDGLCIDTKGVWPPEQVLA